MRGPGGGNVAGQSHSSVKSGKSCHHFHHSTHPCVICHSRSFSHQGAQRFLTALCGLNARVQTTSLQPVVAVFPIITYELIEGVLISHDYLIVFQYFRIAHVIRRDNVKAAVYALCVTWLLLQYRNLDIGPFEGRNRDPFSRPVLAVHPNNGGSPAVQQVRPDTSKSFGRFLQRFLQEYF